MPDQTDNHGFEVNYQAGEQWDYNDEFNALEERVPVTDTDANRPDYTPHADALFFATDTEDIYLGDGTSWNHYANLNTLDAINGADITPASVGKGTSYRSGEMVYYNPADPGPYADGQAALADVPDGGRFVLAAGSDYDVPTEGALTNDRGISIVGEGWHKNDSGNYVGSRIMNTGTDAVDTVINISSDTIGGDGARATVRDLYIEHEGAAQAIEVNNVARSVVADCGIDCNGTAPTGVEFTGASFLSRCDRTLVTAFTDYGIGIRDNGNTNQITHCHATTSQAASEGVRISRPNTWVVGGQYNVADAAGDGVTFWNPESSQMRGGGVIGASAEAGRSGVNIDGDTNRFDFVTVMGQWASCDAAVRFGYTSNSRSLYPTVTGGAEHTIWSADSSRCATITDYGTASNGYTDNGATGPFISIPASMQDVYISNIPTAGGVPVFVRFSPDHNGPVVFDGTDWRDFSTATFTP